MSHPMTEVKKCDPRRRAQSLLAALALCACVVPGQFSSRVIDVFELTVSTMPIRPSRPKNWSPGSTLVSQDVPDPVTALLPLVMLAVPVR